MGYPSLLYKVKPQSKAMSLSVFEDLQLLNFIPKSIAKAIRVPCQGENITARQALFKSLENEKAREIFSRLSDIAADLASYDEALSQAKNKKELVTVFASLMLYDINFSELASSASFGDSLSVSFASAFNSRIMSKEYTEMKNELSSLIPLVGNMLSISFKVKGSSVWVGKEQSESYLDRIISCSKTLGINEPKLPNIKSHRVSPDITSAMLDIHPELYKKLCAFYEKYKNIYSSAITYYTKELRFYLTMLDFFDLIKAENIPLTYPQIVGERGIHVASAYDVSLLAKNEKNIIPNDIEFTEEEPFYFLTGANGGGKTTYLRTVGIAALLYLNGCPVPCASASFPYISGIYTHFPRDERFDGSGRFVEENKRVGTILDSADSDSLVLLNETYSTTNEENAVIMTEKLANELHTRGSYGLYITHQHTLSDSCIPYLNVLIDTSDSNRRTFKIVKEKSVGGSFAKDILVRYKLTPEDLEKRFGSLP